MIWQYVNILLFIFVFYKLMLNLFCAVAVKKYFLLVKVNVVSVLFIDNCIKCGVNI